MTISTTSKAIDISNKNVTPVPSLDPSLGKGLERMKVMIAVIWMMILDHQHQVDFQK
jgi:hypothetical protein